MTHSSPKNVDEIDLVANLKFDFSLRKRTFNDVASGL